MNAIFGDTIDILESAENRLFYVAVTRAINRLFIVTTSSNEITPFLNNISIDKINWSDFPSIKTHQYTIIL